MLIDTLSDTEKRNELSKEKSDIKRFMLSVLDRADYIRRLKKASKFPYSYFASYKSKRGNRYFFVFISDNKKSGAKNPRVNTYVSMDSKEGKYIISIAKSDIGNDFYIIYTPHFFRRYRERFLNDDNMAVNDVVKTFITRNTYHVANIAKGDNIFGMCNDGIIFFKDKDKDVTVAMTFISRDLQKDFQEKEWSEILISLKDWEECLSYNKII